MIPRVPSLVLKASLEQIARHLFALDTLLLILLLAVLLVLALHLTSVLAILVLTDKSVKKN